MTTETLVEAPACTAYPSCSRIARHTRDTCPTIREARALYDSYDGPPPTVAQAWARQEALGRVTDDAWIQAHVLTCRRVAEHPLFPSLVRAIAVAEQPKGPPLRLRLNSPTYGSWWTRGMSPTRFDPQGRPGLYGWDRRARLFAERIRADLGYRDDMPREGEAAVYGVGREYVRAREFPGGRP